MQIDKSIDDAEVCLKKTITDLCRSNNHNKRKHNDIIQLCMLYLDDIMQIWIKY